MNLTFDPTSLFVISDRLAGSGSMKEEKRGVGKMCSYDPNIGFDGYSHLGAKKAYVPISIKISVHSEF